MKLQKLFLILLFSSALSSCGWFGAEPEPREILPPGSAEGMGDLVRRHLDGASGAGEDADLPTGGESGGGGRPSSDVGPLTPEQEQFLQEFMARRCFDSKVLSELSEDQDKDVYGKDCFHGLHLKIKTAQKGDPISTSRAVIPNNPFGIRLEEDLDFINRVYQLGYSLLKGEGSDNKEAGASWLTALLPAGKKFLGSPDTPYRISFEIMGNYLVLLKGSQNLSAIPYIERTSCVNKDEKGHCAPDQNGFYRVPFVGYLISYCYARAQQDRDGKYLLKKEISCSDTEKDAIKKRVEYMGPALSAGAESSPEGQTAEQYLTALSNHPTAPYIKLKQTQSQEYAFLHERNADVKKDLLPSSYFDGEWIFSSGPVEWLSSNGEIAPTRAFLVKLNKTTGALIPEDISGDREAKNRNILVNDQIPVRWMDYRLEQNGGIFESFAEALDETANVVTERRHLQIGFDQFKNGEITDLLITEDYFSFVAEMNIMGQGKVKHKVSLLRRDWLNEQGFVESRYFDEDSNSLFGTLVAKPQASRKEGEHTEAHVHESWRNIKFNTSQNQEIVWHFSKNSCSESEDKGERYRAIARRAVEFYNQAFSLITPEGRDPIRVSLSDEEKDLGDLRYNIINLVCSKDRIAVSGLLGLAPSYVIFDTGQIVGTTANILWHNTESIYEQRLRDYIRYEIFQKDRPHRDREKYNQYHVVTPYMRARVSSLCPEVGRFIESKKQIEGLRPDEDLRDKALILSCRDKLIGDEGLALVLHEMGHSFGLSHNFKCSADEKNYYSSLGDLQESFPSANIFIDEDGKEHLPQTSCVMDYLPVAEAAPLTVLGKYDLAVLKYLYWDQVESSAGELMSLNTPQDASQQTSVLSRWSNGEGLKAYEHCSDRGGIITYQKLSNNQFSDLLCMKSDLGSSPEAIVENHIEVFYRRFNSDRYRYDENEEKFNRYFAYPLHSVAMFYWNWRNLLTQNLQGAQFPPYEINDTEGSGARHQGWLDSLNRSTPSYDLYRAARNSVFNLVKDLHFLLEGMTCELENKETSQRRDVSLEYVQKNLNVAQEGVFVRDCYSPPVRAFLENLDGGKLQLVGQRGVERFNDYQLADFLPVEPSQEVKPDIKAWSLLFLSNRIIPRDSNQTLEKYCQELARINRENLCPGLTRTLGQGFLSVLTEEPDLFDSFRRDTEQRIFAKDSVGGPVIQYSQDMSQMNDLLVLIRVGLIEGARENSRIITNNSHYVSWRRYTTEAGEDSFNEKVKKPALAEGRIEYAKIPFLTHIYNGAYLSETEGDDPYSLERVEGFEDWLMKSNQTIDETDPVIGSGFFIIPFMPDSLTARMILAYNENRDAIEHLEERDDLSFMEEMRKQNLIELDRNLFRKFFSLD